MQSARRWQTDEGMEAPSIVTTKGIFVAASFQRTEPAFVSTSKHWTLKFSDMVS